MYFMSNKLCVCVPGAAVSSPTVRTAGRAAFDSPALQDSLRPFPGAAVLPSALRLLLLLLPRRQHGRSDGKLSSLPHTHTPRVKR